MAPLTLGSVSRGWIPDTTGVLLVIVLVAGYLVGVRRVRRRGLPWPPARVVAWGVGVLVLLVACNGWVGAHAHTMFWDYTVQVLALLLLAPGLLAAGRPLALAVDASSTPTAAATVLRAARSRPVRWATTPVLGPLVIPAVLGAVFFTPLLTASLTRPAVAAGVRVGLLAVGFIVALGLVGDGLGDESSAALGIAVAVGVVELLADAVPGIVLRLRTQLLAGPYWTALPRPHGPSPLADQRFAGAVLWFVAEAADLPVLVLLVRRWIRADAEDAERIDAELDRRSLPPIDAAATAPPPVLQPWWETDPERLRGHPMHRRLERDGQS